ncbi:amidohydrolase/deacetylase family metallohydrolase [Danxiaibacter flavus]|uniref:Amidohydrolase/deacetylase family metallohydrolase n=1 Tax=Danxiaibacter flavus TaxID=3049108 RepID=A0ABV3ZI60_9BACT|nr:amidohydrolase/deacetylase family metallohydrolase [Chitinophagaceae bacterium DXS]
MNRKVFLVFIIIFQATLSWGQVYSIVIKDGHVIDPKNNFDAVMDVAIADGKIVGVAKNIDASKATQVVHAKGLFVTPGLIDIHTHNFEGTHADQYLMDGTAALRPDGFTLRNGVTTVADAGSSGWKTFPLFKQNIIDKSITRVLAFLNIVGEGMRGGSWEQNTTDMDSKLTANVAKANKKDVIGIKLAHFEGHDWIAADRAAEAGRLANIPVMVDFGGAKPPLSIEELFSKHLRKGDIFTHCFAQLGTRESIVDSATKKVKPFVIEAQKDGIFFDVGYGGISFRFSQAIPAIQSGFYPNSISTDLHTGSMNAAMKDLLNVMSKFLNIGMDLPAVIKATTWNPAQEIQRPELGNLSVGTEADIAIFNLRDGNFGFFDYAGDKIKGNKKLECELTIRAGKIVYDLNGISEPVVLKGN